MIFESKIQKDFQVFIEIIMFLRCLHVFYGTLRQNLHHQHVYFGVPRVKGAIHLKAGGYIPDNWHIGVSYFR